MGMVTAEVATTGKVAVTATATVGVATTGKAAVMVTETTVETVATATVATGAATDTSAMD
jgi:hypothetical protein